MNVYIHTWEHNLLSLALEERPAREEITAATQPLFDTELLEYAYAYCESVTALHSRSFHMASSLLPAEKRRAVRALYAFCRLTDDIVDGDVERVHQNLAEGEVKIRVEAKIEIERKVQLERWRHKLQLCASGEHPLRFQKYTTHAAIKDGQIAADDLIAIAWTDARSRYGVPQRYVDQLIDGVACDLEIVRYGSFDELTSYCYGVASTVGLMSMHIIGFAGQEAIPYAIKLGVALQLTNILRDVSEDWRANRLYLPQDELHDFNLTTEKLSDYMGATKENLSMADGWRDFMRFQIARNRRLYEEAWPGIYMLDTDGRFAIAAAAELYRGILNDIEAHDYDIFTRRAHLSRRRKLSRLPQIWWRSRFQPKE